MANILVFGEERFSDAHKELLRRELPHERPVYCGNTATPQQLAEAEIILGNPDPTALGQCGKLRLLQLVSAGIDGYVGSLPEGVRLANATGAYGLAIGEHLLAMLLMLMKKLHLYCRNQDAARWRDEGLVTSVYGAVVLIVGLGDLGGEFARRVHALGGYTIGLRRTAVDRPAYVDELHTADELDALLPRADVVALCLPGAPQTEGLMCERRLSLMKPGAILLNAGRGTAVDQDALVRALQSGRLGGAGVDVTDPEPLPADHPLWRAPNTIITPHVSGGNHLHETYNRILGIAVNNIRAILAGEALRNEIDPLTGNRMR